MKISDKNKPVNTIPDGVWEASRPTQQTNTSYVAPEIREKFESLSVELKNVILEQNVQLNTIHDLIHVLEDICAEDEAE